MAPDDVMGTWTLVSYELYAANGTITRPFGRRPRGYLIYTPEGLMSVAVMPTRRGQPAPPREAIGNPHNPLSWLSPRRLGRLVRFVLAATRYISYSGRYTVQNDTVIHHIDVSQMPGLIGTDQQRTVELRGDQLTLTAQIGGVRQRLGWQRVAAPTRELRVAAPQQARPPRRPLASGRNIPHTQSAGSARHG